MRASSRPPEPIEGSHGNADRVGHPEVLKLSALHHRVDRRSAHLEHLGHLADRQHRTPDQSENPHHRRTTALAETLGDFVDCRVGSRNLRIDETGSELVDDWSGDRIRVRANHARLIRVTQHHGRRTD